MKKIVSILLAAVLLFSLALLTGCGENDDMTLPSSSSTPSGSSSESSTSRESTSERGSSSLTGNAESNSNGEIDNSSTSKAQ